MANSGTPHGHEEIPQSPGRDQTPVEPISAEPKTGREGFGRNTLINIGGLLAPIAISLVTVPLYLHQIGEDRYGVLAIIWVVLGYFAVFEFGLGRATANRIAQLRDEPARRETVFWTALLINLGVGVVGAAILFGVGHTLLGSLIKAPEDLQSQAVAALPWLSAAVPLTTGAAVLSGALEGRERFLALNLVTTFGIAVYQLAPLAYAYAVGPKLTGLIMVSTLALLTSTLVALIAVAAMLPLTHLPRIDRSELGRLFRYGGWVALGGLAGSFFAAADRLAVGIVLGARSVARYTIPASLVTRILILPVGFARTIFPRLSALEPSVASQVSGDALRGLVAFMTPIVVIALVFLEPFLRIWAGAGIADNGAAVGEILLLGVWMNGIAVVPYALLQAQGRPDLTAKISALELAPYLGGLWLGLHLNGLRGAAWAWTARTAVDALLLFWAAGRSHADAGARGQRRVLLVGAMIVTATCISALTLFDAPPVRIGGGFILIAAVLLWAWRLAPPQIRRLAWRKEQPVSMEAS